jgi:hypothetical protein
MCIFLLLLWPWALMASIVGTALVALGRGWKKGRSLFWKKTA